MEPITLDKLVPLVVQWAIDRNLIDGSTAAKQLEKTAAELIELTLEVGRDSAAFNSDDYRLASELGDILVTLIIVGEQLGITLDYALEVAYEKIKDRKGRMIGSKFVKEEDL